MPPRTITNGPRNMSPAARRRLIARMRSRARARNAAALRKQRGKVRKAEQNALKEQQQVNDSEKRTNKNIKVVKQNIETLKDQGRKATKQVGDQYDKIRESQRKFQKDAEKQYAKLGKHLLTARKLKSLKIDGHNAAVERFWNSLFVNIKLSNEKSRRLLIRMFKAMGLISRALGATPLRPLFNVKNLGLFEPTPDLAGEFPELDRKALNEQIVKIVDALRELDTNVAKQKTKFLEAYSKLNKRKQDLDTEIATKNKQLRKQLDEQYDNLKKIAKSRSQVAAYLQRIARAKQQLRMS